MVLEDDRSRPFLVGALFSQTGPTAFVERTQHNAMRLAVEEINAKGGVDGREVSLVSYDAQSDPARFATIAEHLLDIDRVSVLLGCYMTNTRQAVVPVVERRGALLGYTAPYEGFEYSPNVIYGGAVPNQHILALARHLIRNVGKRFYLVGTRYTFPIESNRVMMTLVAEQKGEILSERYVPLAVARHELSSIVEDIRQKKPDVIFCTIVGEAAGLFYELCREAGITSEITIASLTITEAELETMKAGVAEGQLTAATYFESIDTSVNKRFVRSYKARFGVHERLNAMAESAYSLTHMVLSAVNTAGTLDIGSIKAEMARNVYPAPQGEIRLDPENSHFYLWPRIAEVQANGTFRIISESPFAIKPDPYLIHHTLNDWDTAATADVGMRIVES